MTKRAPTATLILATLAAACQSPAPAPAPEASAAARHSALNGSPEVVISQIYGGGGNSQAPYANDFVELFNRSPGVVSIAGWSIQYASATGSGNFSANGVVVLSGSLQPGQHYLVQLFSQAAVGAALPTPNASGTINLSFSAGKVALVNSSAGLSCNGANCTEAQQGSIVDLVGYGSANFFEGTAPAPALSNTTAGIRVDGGCTDSNANNTDFSAGPPAPRNAASPLVPCSGGNSAPRVSSITPTSGAANVPPDSNLVLTFSEPVNATGSWFTLQCGTSGNVSANVSGGPLSFTLDPTLSLAAAENCNLTVIASAVADFDGVPLSADYHSSFTTLAPSGVTAVHTIQGASHVSPLKGASVTTRGIVTALASNGYYLQDPLPDADDSTSEAIFVFTGTAPTVHVGDDTQVNGTVSEFRPGCSGCAPSSSAYANLTTTEISSISAQSVISGNNALPTPIVLGGGGRVPPSSIIEDDAVGDVEILASSFDPSSDGLDFYESLESMRVQVNDAVAVGPTQSFSGGSLELPVLANNGVGSGLRTARGGVVVSASDFNPERITLANDLLPALPNANVGDTFPGAIVGVMSYTFANFKLFETQALPSLVASGVTREISSFGTRRSVDLDIAAFNVENLDPTDPASKFSDLAGILVNNLKAPDLVALEEIQDNNGATSNGVVDASTTLNQLVSAITAAGGPSYSYRSINPVDGQDGGEPGGNIRVVFLYRTDRGLSFVDHPGATSSTANGVVTGATGAELQFSPGRIAPTNGAFANSRKPLAGQFLFQGQTFFVIANHFNSKGGDDPLFGRFQPPTLASETQRVAQANVVKGFVTQLQAVDANAQIIVLGDLNDFEFSAPLMTLKSAGLSTLVERLPRERALQLRLPGQLPGAGSHSREQRGQPARAGLRRRTRERRVLDPGERSRSRCGAALVRPHGARLDRPQREPERQRDWPVWCRRHFQHQCSRRPRRPVVSDLFAAVGQRVRGRRHRGDLQRQRPERQQRALRFLGNGQGGGGIDRCTRHTDLAQPATRIVAARPGHARSKSQARSAPLIE
jgi:predicted extracellular nuclease